jgi:phospholipid/cholesterol/gamma-HCH transport system substrate-binding protein
MDRDKGIRELIMPKESDLEFKVGLFVTVGITLFAMFVFSVGGSPFLKEGKIINVVFEFANGIKKNAPVRIAGVDQGIVKNIDLFFDVDDRKTKARIALLVNKDVKIPQDSKVMINQLGLMGEKYVEIIPGINTNAFYDDGHVIVGKDPIPQEVLAERVMEVANKLEKSILGVNRVIGDGERMESIGTTIDHLEEITMKMNEMVGALRDGNGTMGKLLNDSVLYDNLNGLTSDLSDITRDLKDGKGTLGKFLYDDRIYMDLRELSSDLKDNPWKLLHRSKEK